MAENSWPLLNSMQHSTNETVQDDSTILTGCNHEADPWFSYVIKVPLMMPVVIFGLASNAMNVLIFRHERMRTSMVNWYLVTLATTDIGVLIGSFCMLSLPVICDGAGSLAMLNLGVYAIRWTYAFSLTMQTASVGITVLVGGHRFLGVCFPFKAQRLCTAKRVQKAMLLVAVFAITFNIPRWFELKVTDCQSNLYNATAKMIRVTDMRNDDFYNSGYTVVLYTLVMFAFPFLFLIITNALIVRTVHRSYRLRQMLTNKINTSAALCAASGITNVSERRKSPKYLFNASPQHQRSQSALLESSTASSSANSNSSNLKENKTTIMLIAVVFMFLICNSLAFINNILERLVDPTIPAYSYSVDISNFLVCVNSASNCFIYLTFSARYRSLFRRYMYYMCWCFHPFTLLCCRHASKRQYPTVAAHVRNSAMQLVIEQAQKSPNRLVLRRNDHLNDPTPCLMYSAIPIRQRALHNGSLRQKAMGNSIAGIGGGSIRRTNSQRDSNAKLAEEAKAFKPSAVHEPIAESQPQPRDALLSNRTSNLDYGTPTRRRASTISAV